MANSLFQIERSRKVVISIPGYDPVLETQKIEKRFKRLREKKKRNQEVAAQRQKEILKAQLKDQEAALEELNKGSLLSPQAAVTDSPAETEGNLFE